MYLYWIVFSTISDQYNNKCNRQQLLYIQYNFLNIIRVPYVQGVAIQKIKTENLLSKKFYRITEFKKFFRTSQKKKFSTLVSNKAYFILKYYFPFFQLYGQLDVFISVICHILIGFCSYFWATSSVLSIQIVNHSHI